MATVTHAKTDNIPDPTQADLDEEIALENYPVGTVLADIVLSSDWNADHTVTLGADENFVTDDELTVLQNTSGTNTGDATSIVGITGTKAQFDTAVTDGNFLYVGDVTQYTDEMAQDATGAMVSGNTETLIAVTYDDAGNKLNFAVTPTLSSYTNDAGFLTGNQNITLSGAVTGSGTTAITTALGSFTSLQLKTALTDETGSGAAVFADTPTLIAPLLGTPTSGALTNCTGLPVGSGISGLGANVATFLATPSSANLAAAVTGETGTGALVFATSPALVTPDIGTPSAGVLTNCTGLPTAGLVNDAVTYAKIQNVSATSRILGRITTGAGDIEELTAANVATIINSSIIAPNITVANEASDTTCFPVFVTAATGDLGPKTNANLAYNASTGDLLMGVAARMQFRATGNYIGSSATDTLDVGGNVTTNVGLVQGDIVLGGNAAHNMYCQTAGNMTLGKVGNEMGFLRLIGSVAGNAPFRMLTGTAPTSPVEGDIWLDSTQKSYNQFTAGITQIIPGTLFRQTATATVANTTTRTTLTSTGVGTLTLPANFWTVGKTVYIEAWGVISHTVLAPTLLMEFYENAVVLMTTGTQALAATAVTNDGWHFRGSITCRTTGSSGTAFAQGEFFLTDTATGIGAGTRWQMSNTGTITINTTVTEALDMQITWGTASASNSMSCTNFTVRTE